MDYKKYAQMVGRLKSKGYDEIHSRFGRRSLYEAFVFVARAAKSAKFQKDKIFFGAGQNSGFHPPTHILNVTNIGESDFDLLHAALGLVTEAAEFAELWGRGSKEEMLDELGDILWYLVLALNTLGSDLDEIMEINNAKLRERYGDSFSEDRWAAKDKSKEAEAVKKARNEQAK
jgi:NTP pyrophosphatase (non-canonical NTP hydrolase)